MIKKQIKLNAVIFDMDGVIINSMPNHYAAWKKVFAMEGIHVSRQEVYSREGQPGRQTIKELFELNQLKYSDLKAEEMLMEKELLFKQHMKMPYIAHSKSFLRKLNAKHFTLALVTGTARHEMEKILPEDILRLFSVIVTGTDIINGKPHPEPYIKALNLLKLDATEAIVIENAPFGIKSAKAAHLSCIALETSLPREYLNDADYIFTSFNELEANIEFILKRNFIR